MYQHKVSTNKTAYLTVAVLAALASAVLVAKPASAQPFGSGSYQFDESSNLTSTYDSSTDTDNSSDTTDNGTNASSNSGSSFLDWLGGGAALFGALDLFSGHGSSGSPATGGGSTGADLPAGSGSTPSFIPVSNPDGFQPAPESSTNVSFGVLMAAGSILALYRNKKSAKSIA